MGQYLRDQRSGCSIFLIVYKDQKGFWKHPESGNNLDFLLLLEELKSFVDRELAAKPCIEAIEVVGIDLTLR